MDMNREKRKEKKINKSKKKRNEKIKKAKRKGKEQPKKGVKETRMKGGIKLKV